MPQLIRCFLLVFPLLLISSNPLIGGEGDVLEIKISRQTTLEELEQIQQKLEQEGIQMEILKRDYKASNHLHEIRIKVNFGKGNIRTFRAKNFKHFWIIRNGRKDAEQLFYIGGKRPEL